MALVLTDQTVFGDNLTNNNGVSDITSTSPFTALTHVGGFARASSQTLSAPSSATLNVTGSFTAQCWVYFNTLPDASRDGECIAKYKTATNDRSYHCYITYADVGGVSTMSLGVSSGGDAGTTSTKASTSFTLATGTWYHFAWSYNASTHTGNFIKDGATLNTDGSFTPTSIFASAAPFEIGGVTSFTNYNDAYIGDVRLYNVARNATTVNSDKSQLLIGTEPNLVGYWPFLSIPRGGFIFNLL